MRRANAAETLTKVLKYDNKTKWTLHRQCIERKTALGQHSSPWESWGNIPYIISECLLLLTPFTIPNTCFWQAKIYSSAQPPHVSLVY